MQITQASLANGRNPVSTLNLTHDQKIAYDDIIEFINSPFDQNDFRRALVGPAGTGKTYLVNALITNCNLSYSVIGLSAPTHKACRVLSESIKNTSCKVITLQSALGLRLNFDVEKFDINNPPFDPKGKIKIEDLKLFIVDESSMINKGLKIFLERICNKNQCKILYIGDGHQLPPVNERTSSAFEHIKLFRLNQIVRQDDDNPVKELLYILRDDIENGTFNFINYISQYRQKFDESYIKGWQICNQKQFSDIIYNNFNDEQLTTNVDFCKIIAYTNNCVSAWNKFVRNAIIKDADKIIINKNDLILSYTTIVDQWLSPIIQNSEEYIVKDIVNYTHPNYGLKGYMVKFIAIHGGQETTPLFIIDHSDNYTIQKYIQISNELIDVAKKSPVRTRAQRWKDYYTFKESCLLLTNIIKRDGAILYSRDLDYGFALTGHKAQGSTYDTVFVDLIDILYDKNGRPYTKSEEIKRLIYTACSRCRNKLYIKFG